MIYFTMNIVPCHIFSIVFMVLIREITCSNDKRGVEENLLPPCTMGKMPGEECGDPSFLQTIEVRAVLVRCHQDKEVNEVFHSNPRSVTNISAARMEAILQFPGYDNDEAIQRSNVVNCRKKIIFSLSMSNMGKTNTEDQFVVVDHVIDSVSGKKVRLVNPYVLKVRQEASLQLYNLKFINVVNGEVREEVINKKNANFTGCDDSSDNPTCGFAYYKDKKVPFSEGFCCSCDATVNAQRQPPTPHRPSTQAPSNKGGSCQVSNKGYEKSQTISPQTTLQPIAENKPVIISDRKEENTTCLTSVKPTTTTTEQTVISTECTTQQPCTKATKVIPVKAEKSSCKSKAQKEEKPPRVQKPVEVCEISSTCAENPSTQETNNEKSISTRKHCTTKKPTTKLHKLKPCPTTKRPKPHDLHSSKKTCKSNKGQISDTVPPTEQPQTTTPYPPTCTTSCPTTTEGVTSCPTANNNKAPKTSDKLSAVDASNGDSDSVKLIPEEQTLDQVKLNSKPSKRKLEHLKTTCSIPNITAEVNAVTELPEDTAKEDDMTEEGVSSTTCTDDNITSVEDAIETTTTIFVKEDSNNIEDYLSSTPCDTDADLSTTELSVTLAEVEDSDEDKSEDGEESHSDAQESEKKEYFEEGEARSLCKDLDETKDEVCLVPSQKMANIQCDPASYFSPKPVGKCSEKTAAEVKKLKKDDAKQLKEENEKLQKIEKIQSDPSCYFSKCPGVKNKQKAALKKSHCPKAKIEPMKFQHAQGKSKNNCANAKKTSHRGEEAVPSRKSGEDSVEIDETSSDLEAENLMKMENLGKFNGKSRTYRTDANSGNDSKTDEMKEIIKWEETVNNKLLDIANDRIIPWDEIGGKTHSDVEKVVQSKPSKNITEKKTIEKSKDSAILSKKPPIDGKTISLAGIDLADILKGNTRPVVSQILDSMSHNDQFGDLNLPAQCIKDTTVSPKETTSTVCSTTKSCPTKCTTRSRVTSTTPLCTTEVKAENDNEDNEDESEVTVSSTCIQSSTTSEPTVCCDLESVSVDLPVLDESIEDAETEDDEQSSTCTTPNPTRDDDDDDDVDLVDTKPIQSESKDVSSNENFDYEHPESSRYQHSKPRKRIPKSPVEHSCTNKNKPCGQPHSGCMRHEGPVYQYMPTTKCTSLNGPKNQTTNKTSSHSCHFFRCKTKPVSTHSPIAQGPCYQVEETYSSTITTFITEPNSDDLEDNIVRNMSVPCKYVNGDLYPIDKPKVPETKAPYTYKKAKTATNDGSSKSIVEDSVNPIEISETVQSDNIKSPIDAFYIHAKDPILPNEMKPEKRHRNSDETAEFVPHYILDSVPAWQPRIFAAMAPNKTDARGTSNETCSQQLTRTADNKGIGQENISVAGTPCTSSTPSTPSVNQTLLSSTTGVKGTVTASPNATTPTVPCTNAITSTVPCTNATTATVPCSTSTMTTVPCSTSTMTTVPCTTVKLCTKTKSVKPGKTTLKKCAKTTTAKASKTKPCVTTTTCKATTKECVKPTTCASRVTVEPTTNSTTVTTKLPITSTTVTAIPMITPTTVTVKPNTTSTTVTVKPNSTFTTVTVKPNSTCTTVTVKPNSTCTTVNVKCTTVNVKPNSTCTTVTKPNTTRTTVTVKPTNSTVIQSAKPANTTNTATVNPMTTCSTPVTVNPTTLGSSGAVNTSTASVTEAVKSSSISTTTSAAPNMTLPVTNNVNVTPRPCAMRLPKKKKTSTLRTVKPCHIRTTREHTRRTPKSTTCTTPKPPRTTRSPKTTLAKLKPCNVTATTAGKPIPPRTTTTTTPCPRTKVTVQPSTSSTTVTVKPSTTCTTSTTRKTEKLIGNQKSKLSDNYAATCKNDYGFESLSDEALESTFEDPEGEDVELEPNGETNNEVDRSAKMKELININNKFYKTEPDAPQIYDFQEDVFMNDYASLVDDSYDEIVPIEGIHPGRKTKRSPHGGAAARKYHLKGPISDAHRDKKDKKETDQDAENGDSKISHRRKRLSGHRKPEMVLKTSVDDDNFQVEDDGTGWTGRGKRQVLSSGQQVRGGQDCADRTSPAGVDAEKYQESAHCLRFSDLWYTVYRVGDPLVVQTISIQLFEKSTLPDGRSQWKDITNGNVVKLSTFNPKARDPEPTMSFEFVSMEESKQTFALDESRARVLIPQPVARDKACQYPQLQGGPREYLVVDSSQVGMDGLECDVAGVGFEGFSKQPERCGRPRGSCLHNQPIDFWREDMKARIDGKKGRYFLENFGTVPREPIKTDSRDSEFIALEYRGRHDSAVAVEVKADFNTVVRTGTTAQITEVYSDSTCALNHKVTLLLTNTGMATSLYQARITDCPPETPAEWSKTVGPLIPIDPQEAVVTELVLEGELTVESVHCSVEVLNVDKELVATRRFRLQMNDRCLCVWFCLCACIGSVDGLYCKPMSSEHHYAANFEGSLPIVTGGNKSIFDDPVMSALVIIFAVIAILLLLGLTKAILGLCCCPVVGVWGLHILAFYPFPLRQYYEREIDECDVVYDEYGYPVHPKSGWHSVRAMGHAKQFFLNVIFFLALPMAILFKCCRYCCWWCCEKGAEDDYCQLHGCGAKGFGKVPQCNDDICFDTYQDDADREQEANRYVRNEMQRSKEMLKNYDEQSPLLKDDKNEKSGGDRSQPALNVTDSYAEQAVDQLLKKRLVFQNSTCPQNGVEMPDDTAYCIRGIFLKHGGGYKWVAQAPLLQYWVFEYGELSLRKQPKQLDANAFELNFRTAREVIESRQLTTLPKGFCINLKYQDDINYMEEISSKEDIKDP